MLVTIIAVAASLLAIFATISLLYRQRPQIVHKPSSALHFACTPGVKFAYHECGRKSDPLVLVLHGFPDTAISFCALLSGIAAQGRRCVLRK
jgi:hypothetical protein